MRGFHDLFPLCEVKNDLWSLCYSIPPNLGKTMVTGWIGLNPIGVFPVGASGCGGDCERADLTGPNLKCFYGCLGEELLSVLN